MAAAALTAAVLSLVISAVTAWLTLFRRGTVKMTQPTVIYFGPDISEPRPKVYLRTLLFATSKRGRVIESMHVALAQDETHQNFNIWVYRERDQLVRGSGLFVGETGVAADHHFLLPRTGSERASTGSPFSLAYWVMRRRSSSSRKTSRSPQRSRHRSNNRRLASTSTGDPTPRGTCDTWMRGNLH